MTATAPYESVSDVRDLERFLVGGLLFLDGVKLAQYNGQMVQGEQICHKTQGN